MRFDDTKEEEARKFVGYALDRKQCLDFMRLAFVMRPNKVWVSVVDCFCLSILAHTSIFLLQEWLFPLVNTSLQH